MENNTIDKKEKGVKTAKIQRVATGVPFTKDDPRINREGRPQGKRNFATDFREAISLIKDKDTGESLTEIGIIKIAVQKMLTDPAKFVPIFQDLMDRNYGPAGKENEDDNGGNLLASQIDVFLNENGGIQISEKTLKLMKDNGKLN